MACNIEEYQKRAIAIVLQERVQGVYDGIKAIYEITKDWVLDEEDSYLPSSSSIKAQLEVYEALSKPPITLSHYLSILKQCDIVIPDHLVFDGTWVFDQDNPPIF